MVTGSKEMVIPGTGEIVTASQMALTLHDTMELGEVLAQSGMFPDCKNKAQAVAKILLGRELGLSPVYSLQKIYVVYGRLQIGYELVAALINRSEHYRYVVIEKTPQRCSVEFYRDGQRIGPPSVWTLEDAKRAGLTKPDSNWQKYPETMCFARALTLGARMYCPEILAGTEILEESDRETTPTGELTKAGDPPPSAWMGFWASARDRGYTDEAKIHKVLGVASLKDWLASGKSLDEALAALPNLKAAKDADTLYGTGVKTQDAGQKKAPASTPPPSDDGHPPTAEEQAQGEQMMQGEPARASNPQQVQIAELGVAIGYLNPDQAARAVCKSFHVDSLAELTAEQAAAQIVAWSEIKAKQELTKKSGTKKEGQQ